MKRLCLALVLFPATAAQAAWPADAGLDVPVANIESSGQPNIIDDGKNGVFVVFSHSSSNSTPKETLRGEHFDDQGAHLWGSPDVDGGLTGKDLLGLAVTPEGAGNILAVSDGDGGLIAAYGAGPATGPWAVTLQRFQADATPLWAPTGSYGGIALTSNPADNNYLWLVSDQVGGAFVTWEIPQGDGLVGQRLDSTGALQYSAAGTTFASGQANPAAYSSNFASGDGLGGMYYLWSPNGDLNTDPMLEHVNPSGSQDFLVAAVAPVRPLFDEWAVLGQPGAAGCWATWFQNGSKNGALYLQRYTAAGAPVLAGDAGGTLVEVTGPVSATYAQLANDGNGGVIMAWEDTSADAGNVVYAQRFNPDGSTAWGDSPIAVSMAGVTTPRLDPFRLISTRDGQRLALVWQTLPNGIAAEEILATTGAAQWGAQSGGIVVSLAGVGSKWYDATFVGDESAYVTWQDGLNRIYAKRINADGTLGSEIEVPDAGPGEPDAGPDAGEDGGEDAGPDAGPDAGVDAGPDAGVDAGTDAGPNPGLDAGVDAGAVVEAPDAGASASKGGSGCGSSSTGGSPIWILAGGIAVWSLVRRRRRS